MGGDAVSNRESRGYCNTQEGTEAGEHLLPWVLEGMRKYIKKSFNYEKAKGATQEGKENPALCQGRLVVFKKNLLTWIHPFLRAVPAGTTFYQPPCP